MYPLQVFSRFGTDRLLEIRAFCLQMKPFSERYGKLKHLETQGTLDW